MQSLSNTDVACVSTFADSCCVNSPRTVDAIICGPVFCHSVPAIAEYCDEHVCVCLSASVSHELQIQSSPHFCACYLRLWLGPPLAAVQCYLLPVYG